MLRDLAYFVLCIQFLIIDASGQDSNIIDELNYTLKYELLNKWYPATIDKAYGGFLCDFSFDWKPHGPQNKMIVTQARHVWTASNVAIFYQDTLYHQIAEHGYQFLRDHMWDKKYGGFFQVLNRKGEATRGTKSEGKTAYGNAFALYALSSFYHLSGDTGVLNLAKKSFQWLEKYSHDSVYGGYFDKMLPDGSNYIAGNTKLKGMDRERACWKDFNSSIHLLEAFTELYKVWPDSLLHERINEMLTIIRDTITDEKGYMKLFFKSDWTHISYLDSSKALQKENWYYDHVSFGHDVETAYLMLEASHVLGLKEDSSTLLIAKKMVNHALSYGWDKERGGFYDMGYYYNKFTPPTIIRNAKIWWTQAEGLNALLMMANLFPTEERYRQCFILQWNYINTYLIDHTHGEWYIEGLDNSPKAFYSPKASQWKINYHNSRALMNCIRMLENEHNSGY